MTLRRPGEAKADRDSMLRVNQAGEFGATRIYAGQLAVMGDRHPMARSITGMAAQEERHRLLFDAMMTRRGVRPTFLAPLWDRAGFALGAITAAIGPEAAMACTAAIETEIDRHYSKQLAELGDEDPEMADAIRDFQAEEVEHRDTAFAAGAETAPAFPLLFGLVRLGCRTAIALSKRI